MATTNPKTTASRKAALYARFSSDMQKDRSISDQFTVLEKYAARENLKIVERFSDRAKSGASMLDREGLRDLIAAAKRKQFDVLVVEATDRLSRNQADLPWIFQMLGHHGVKIYTPSNGEVTEMQIAFDGISNPGYSKKLAERVKRGADGLAREGKIPGARAYGYDPVLHCPGETVINKKEAKVVVRIFEEYASGSSPRQIADGLMADKIVSPSGTSLWNFQGIVGGSGSKRGILNNRLYIGESVRNRYFNVKNPETGKIVVRKSDETDLIVIKVPELRIVDQKLWNAAHGVRLGRAHHKFPSGYVQRAVVPRKQHLLAGLLRCGECNGAFSVTASSRTGQRVGCSGAYNRRSCPHSKSYDLGQLTALAVDSMCNHLTDPEFIREKAKAKAIEFARLEKENSGARREAQRQFDRLNIQIAKLVRAVEEDDDLPRELMQSLKAKEIERRGLEERIRLLGAETNVTTLHPNVITTFGKNIETLHAKLKRNQDDAECRVAFGNIIDSILVHRTERGQPYDISLYARLSAIIGVDLFPQPRTNAEIIAAEGFPRVAVQSDAGNRFGLNRYSADIILLGRWKAAA